MAAIVFPISPVEDQLFEENGRKWVYQDGAWRLYSSVNGTDPISFALQRYDLAIENTTGAGNLKEAQVFLINNTVPGAKTLSLSNPPAGRAMTVVFQITGNAGAVALPAGVRYAVGVDSSLSAVETLFILFWNGSALTATANIKRQ